MSADAADGIHDEPCVGRCTSRRRHVVTAAGVVATVAATGLAACDSAADTARPVSGARLAPAKLSMQMGGPAESQSLLKDRLLPAFSELHPSINVELLAGGMPLDKLRTLAAAGETPELFMNGAAFAPAIAEGKYALALDDRLKTWGNLNDYFAPSLHASSWAGKQWGLPFMVANRTHLWRKNVLQEAGISRTPSNWDEVVDAARRSTRVEGGTITRAGNIPPDGWTYFVAAMLTVGKTLFRAGKAEFAGPEGVAAMEYLLDIYRGVRPPGATPATGATFQAGGIAHTWTNMTAVRQIEQTAPQDLPNLVVADPPVPGSGRYRMPASARVKPISPNFSDWLCIGSLSRYPDHAWELLKFLAEPENLLAYCESRYFQPPRKSVANQGFMKQPLLRRMVEVFDKYGHAQIRVHDQAIFITTMQQMGNDVYVGKMPPRQAVEETARLLQNEVDKAGFKGTTL